MKIETQMAELEESIAANKNFVFTLLSYLMIPVIVLNLSFHLSPIIGVLASLVYLSINATFLGRAFFRDESRFLRFILGVLVLILSLGLIGWLTMIAWNLDIVRSVIVLILVATFSSVVGLIGKHPRSQADPEAHNPLPSQGSRIISVCYLLLVGILLYLLLISRSGEAHTVWEVLNPLFIPVYFFTTLLLLSVVLLPGNADKKLLLVIIHCIISHSLFAVIFPAGDIGAQILTLGKSRLVYENISINGWPVSLPPTSSLFSRIYYWFRGINFQTALSVMFARMLGVDILWTHLWFVPLFWGTFVPVATFLISRTLGFGERTSILAGLLVSLCPNTVYYGAISVANSIGFVLFFISIYFALRYLNNGGRDLFLLLLFSFFSFLSHFLTGVMSLSMLLLTITLRQYVIEKGKSSKSTKVYWLISLIFCSSLIPIFLLYQKLFFPFYTYIGLRNVRGLPLPDMIAFILLGGYVDFSAYGALLNAAGAMLGLFGMIYCLRRKIKVNSDRISLLGPLFIFSGFLIALMDYRALKVFMVGVPFNVERIWVFRDLFAIPFLGLLLTKVIDYFRERVPMVVRSRRFPHFTLSSIKAKRTSIIIPLLILIALSSWSAISLLYSYPHFAPLQTTSYELEAAKFIEENTQERYVVISDPWFIRAGQAMVGTTNPQSYYFSLRDPKGISLYVEMRSDPTNATMISAVKENNATTAYFVIEKPRLGSEEYNQIVSQAQQNGVQTYQVFHLEGEEKLRAFYYRIEAPT